MKLKDIANVLVGNNVVIFNKNEDEIAKFHIDDFRNLVKECTLSALSALNENILNAEVLEIGGNVHYFCEDFDNVCVVLDLNS